MTDPPHPEVAILNAALELRPAERAAYLDQACAGDAALRQQVEALLAAHEQAEDFLESPPTGLDFKRTVLVNIPLTEKAGDKIGRYKLLQQIGEGGCGVVYMAEQEEPVRRRVALKVIKLGMDTKEVIARFEAERQALAMMDHPNIAKIYDAGVTDAPLPASGHPLPVGRGEGQGEGSANSQPSTLNAQLSPGRPYFVMELVRGIRITDFCDENNVSTQDRLKLFVQVCQAIQHAHQKGVIHRDIKPSNILVTINDGVPVPKVIDFGIAKATAGRLTDQTIFTAFEQFIGTPAYMSPEQAVMTSLDIDTRSDIYSLGVLLYELLTAKTPFDAQELLAAGLDEMRRIIREQEPSKPSTRLTLELLSTQGGKGEMGKKGSVATARSESPSPLFSSAPFPPHAAAQPQQDNQTSAHRLHQLKQLIPALRGDLDWIVMKCLEKDRARRYETANGVAMDILRHLNCEPVVARPPSRLYEFQKTVRRHKVGFAAAAALIAVLAAGVIVSTLQAVRATRAEQEQIRLLHVAESKEKKSEQVAGFLKDMLQGVEPSVALGRDATMLREILDKTAERVGKDLKNQPEVEAELRSVIGNTYFELGDFPKAEKMHREALRLRKALFGETNEYVADSLHNLAVVLLDRWEVVEAKTIERQALAMRKKLFGNEHPAVVSSLACLADLLLREDNLAEAETVHREALRIQRKLLGNENPDLVDLLNSLAIVLTEQGKLTESETDQLEALRIQRKLLGNGNPVLADSLNNVAIVLTEHPKLTEAETLGREALALCQKLPGNKLPSLATSLNRLGRALKLQGRLAEAEIIFREAVEMRRKLLGNEHPYVASAIGSLAEVLVREEKFAEGEAALREWLALRRLRAPLGNERNQVASGLIRLAGCLQQQGKLAEAESCAREALAITRKLWPGDIAKWGESIDALGDALLRQRKDAEIAELFGELLTPSVVSQREGASLLGHRAHFLVRRGRWQEAVTDFTKAIELDPADHRLYHALAPLLVAIEDLEGYRLNCNRILARFGATTNLVVAERMANACLILPATGVDLETPANMAEMAVTAGNKPGYLPYFQFAHGLAEYRQGRLASTLDWMHKALASPRTDSHRDLQAQMVLAMAHYKLKQMDLARSALAKGVEIEQTKLPRLEDGDLGEDWTDWLIAAALKREAKALIEGPNSTPLPAP